MMLRRDFRKILFGFSIGMFVIHITSVLSIQALDVEQTDNRSFPSLNSHFHTNVSYDRDNIQQHLRKYIIGGRSGDEKKNTQYSHEKSPRTTSQARGVQQQSSQPQPRVQSNQPHHRLQPSQQQQQSSQSHVQFHQPHHRLQPFQQQQQPSQSHVQFHQPHHSLQPFQHQQQSSQSHVQFHQPHHRLQLSQQQQDVIPQSNYTFLLQQIQLHQSQGHQKEILKYLQHILEHLLYVQRETNHLFQSERYLSLLRKYQTQQALNKDIRDSSNRTKFDRELLEMQLNLQSHLQALQQESQNLQRQSRYLYEQSMDLPRNHIFSSILKNFFDLNQLHSGVYRLEHHVDKMESQHKNLCHQREKLYELGLFVRHQQFIASHNQALQSQPQQSVPSRVCIKRPFVHYQKRQSTTSGTNATSEKRSKLLNPSNKIPQKIHPTRKSHLVSQQDQQPSCSWQQSKDQKSCDEVVQPASFSKDIIRPQHQHQHLHPLRTSTSASSGTKQSHRELEQDLKPSCSWQQPQQSCEMNLSRSRISSNSTSDSDVQGSTMEALTLSLQRQDRDRSCQVIQPESSSDSVLEDINRPQQQHPSQTTTPRTRQSDPEIVISCSLQQSPHSRERNIACFVVSSNSASQSESDYRVSTTESVNSPRPTQDQEGHDEVFQPATLSGSLRKDASRQ